MMIHTAHTAHTVLDALTARHLSGHTCEDGNWWNPNTGTRSRCAILTHLDVLYGHIDHLANQLHEAAHNDTIALAVGTDAIGYYDDWVANDLNDEDRAGILMIGRRAIERLCVELDREPANPERETP